MRELEAILELGRGGDVTDGAGDPTPRALGRSMVGGLGEVLYQEIVAGQADRLPALLPELMYALVLPFEGREAAQRELERAPRRSLSSL